MTGRLDIRLHVRIRTGSPTRDKSPSRRNGGWTKAKASYFAEPRLAEVLHEAILYFQDRRYLVSCFTIMPNHCHLVIRPFATYALETVLQICKGYTASRVTACSGQAGRCGKRKVTIGSFATNSTCIRSCSTSVATRSRPGFPGRGGCVGFIRAGSRRDGTSKGKESDGQECPSYESGPSKQRRDNTPCPWGLPRGLSATGMAEKSDPGVRQRTLELILKRTTYAVYDKTCRMVRTPFKPVPIFRGARYEQAARLTCSWLARHGAGVGQSKIGDCLGRTESRDPESGRLRFAAFEGIP